MLLTNSKCEFECKEQNSCIMGIIGNCLNCIKLSCQSCIHFDKDNGCELESENSNLKKFYTELIMEQNEQK